MPLKPILGRQDIQGYTKTSVSNKQTNTRTAKKVEKKNPKEPMGRALTSLGFGIWVVSKLLY